MQVPARNKPGPRQDPGVKQMVWYAELAGICGGAMVVAFEAGAQEA